MCCSRRYKSLGRPGFGTCHAHWAARACFWSCSRWPRFVVVATPGPNTHPGVLGVHRCLYRLPSPMPAPLAATWQVQVLYSSSSSSRFPSPSRLSRPAGSAAGTPPQPQWVQPHHVHLPSTTLRRDPLLVRAVDLRGADPHHDASGAAGTGTDMTPAISAAGAVAMAMSHSTSSTRRASPLSPGTSQPAPPPTGGMLGPAPQADAECQGSSSLLLQRHSDACRTGAQSGGTAGEGRRRHGSGVHREGPPGRRLSLLCLVKSLLLMAHVGAVLGAFTTPVLRTLMTTANSASAITSCDVG
jgi:hypothetical protein